MNKRTQRDETIANAISLEILNSGFKFPPMPANGPKLMQLVRQPVEKIDTDELIKLIEPDPGIYSMVLQLANSIYFKGVEDVVSLRSAIGRVGLKEAIESVNFYFFQRMLPEIPEIEGFSVKHYWAFSWACAVAARRLGHPNLGLNVLPGELYIAGLLHGIGKLIFAINHPDRFSRCIQMARQEELPLHVIELEEFGTTDALVASKLLGVWNIPAGVIAGVRHYQDPGAAPKDSRDIAALIQYAYSLAAVSGIGANGDGIIMPPESTWILKESRSLLTKTEIREPITREIFQVLEEKSESVTGVSSKDKQDSPALPGKGRPGPGPAVDPEKKGLFSWVKSIFT
ncbi:HDOD domain-containing protein [Desulfospira joergensenii]|uniref:HDOD domain-containing protein n=1 Tax=Desulfospira joergensenii TaxID=53329 RepID=UPI0003B4E50C|nr:HDOD domain-containing protein [Desulfospira joergensenii]